MTVLSVKESTRGLLRLLWDQSTPRSLLLLLHFGLTSAICGDQYLCLFQEEKEILEAVQPSQQKSYAMVFVCVVTKLINIQVKEIKDAAG